MRLHMVIGGILLGCTNAATAQFAAPVTGNEPYYGPGRIGANGVAVYAGQQVDACGRVGNYNQRLGTILLGNNLMVYLPQSAAVASYWGKVVCAAGLVRMETRDYGTSPAIDIENEQQQIAVIGGPGPYQPPQPECGPGQMPDPQRGCVRRWRASPY
jgi:hypothetical protein